MILGESMSAGIVIYLIAVNITEFLLFGIDKRKAIRGEWRVPESTLLSLAVFGGAVGGILGMRIFHHKTKHPKFYLGIPAILVMEIAVLCFSHIRGIVF